MKTPFNLDLAFVYRGTLKNGQEEYTVHVQHAKRNITFDVYLEQASTANERTDMFLRYLANWHKKAYEETCFDSIDIPNVNCGDVQNLRKKKMEMDEVEWLLGDDLHEFLDMYADPTHAIQENTAPSPW